MDKPWAIPALIGTAATLAAGATLSVPAISGALAIVAIASFVAAGLKARKDPYSLDSLRDFHDKEELREIDVPGVDVGGDVMCGRCRNSYSGRLPGCPHCGAAR
ncbi:hypothetical protein EON81_07685 [bacterium]|nr:MAG: hypothetical protein EON81_07685 [bacterium]